MQFLEIPLGITCHIEPPEQGVINTYYTEDNLCLTVYSQRASLNSCLVKMVKIIWKISLGGGGIGVCQEINFHENFKQSALEFSK